MIKVITYGTYDLLHYGHIRLLERAKALGDYLIVGVTADDFDKNRGKINVQQSLMERIEAVRATGYADEIIIEEYEGQKIDDILKYDIDIFTVGSDWKGKFDYLKEYCEVVYLDRTEGVSSSKIRNDGASIKLGLVGESQSLNKILKESAYVNGIIVNAIYTENVNKLVGDIQNISMISDDYDKMLDSVDAVYVRSAPARHYEDIKRALDRGKHVICESPVTLKESDTQELYDIAENKKLILMEAIKTAYSTAYRRLLLLAKSGKIGEIVSVDATCTSLKDENEIYESGWNGIYEWGPTALLPVLQLLGVDNRSCSMVTRFRDNYNLSDSFTKIDFLYDSAVASVKVGDGVKSEGNLIISGTKGYIYVPAPWWKTEYFEARFENATENRRYFYPLDGEGIRYEIVAFVRAVENRRLVSNINKSVTYKISQIMDDFVHKDNMIVIH
jgi:choline-phosphate cytidylyltransferase